MEVQRIELTYDDGEAKIFPPGHCDGAKMKTGDLVVPGEELRAN
jgi:hypothetical protein